MKKTWLIPVVGVALLAGGCSEDTGDAGNAPAQESNAPA